MFHNVVKRCAARRKADTKTIIDCFQHRDNSFTPNSKIIRSKLPDIVIPDLSVEELVFKDLDKWEHKIAVVSSINY